MIYFFRRANGDIKIGITTDYHRRFYQLELEYGKLILLGLMDGGRKEELLLHAEFSEYGLAREWFQPVQPILEFIAQNTHLNIPEKRPAYNSRKTRRDNDKAENHARKLEQAIENQRLKNAEKDGMLSLLNEMLADAQKEIRRLTIAVAKKGLI